MPSPSPSTGLGWSIWARKLCSVFCSDEPNFAIPVRPGTVWYFSRPLIFLCGSMFSWKNPGRRPTRKNELLSSWWMTAVLSKQKTCPMKTYCVFTETRPLSGISSNTPARSCIHFLTSSRFCSESSSLNGSSSVVTPWMFRAQKKTNKEEVRDRQFVHWNKRLMEVPTEASKVHQEIQKLHPLEHWKVQMNHLNC